MKVEAKGRYYLLNGQAHSLPEDCLIELPAELRVYEVVRLVDGIAIFLADHLTRLYKSAAMSGFPPLPAEETILAWIRQLATLNAAEDINLRIEYCALAAGEFALLFYLVPSVYPTEQMYQHGVQVELFKWVRENPEAKIWHDEYKRQVAAALADSSAYELLLVDDRGRITEGSRSNVFWVKGEDLYTAPDSLILAGITRKYVFQAISEANFLYHQTAVTLAESEEMDGCFLCGTSPKILPIAAIGTRRYASGENKVIRRLMRGLDEIIQGYLKVNRKNEG